MMILEVSWRRLLITTQQIRVYSLLSPLLILPMQSDQSLPVLVTLSCVLNWLSMLFTVACTAILDSVLVALGVHCAISRSRR
jgi:hypothetical protein